MLHFSYIGTSFSGSQQQVVAGSQIVRTVQGIIEQAFQCIKLVDRSRLTLASRTDAGVHALANTLHFDAVYSKEHMRESREPDPQMFLLGLNTVLDRWNEPIRIWRAERVPPDFNCRSAAISREYLFRLAVMKPSVKNAGPLAPLTATESFRSLVYTGEFNEELLFKGAELLSGVHSFRNFTTAESLQEKGGSPTKPMVVTVKPSQAILGDVWPFEYSDQICFYDLFFKSNSFFYHQIRRMMGCLIQVASKRIPLSVVEDLLTGKEPAQRGQPHATPTVSPCGLYLRKIEYNPNDLVMPDGSTKSDDLPVDVLKSFVKRSIL